LERCSVLNSEVENSDKKRKYSMFCEVENSLEQLFVKRMFYSRFQNKMRMRKVLSRKSIFRYIRNDKNLILNKKNLSMEYG